MDLVLKVLDDVVLDKLWAHMLPLKLPVDDLLLRGSNASFLPLPSPTPSYLRAAATSAAQHTIQSSSELPEWVLTSAWPREDWRRQFISLCLFTLVGIHIMYFVVAGASYKFLFDHRMMQHPRFLKGQIKLEMRSSLWAFPWLTLMIVPCFLGEVRGYSKCYDAIADGPLGGGLAGWAYVVFSCAFFLAFTDFFIYLIHRWEHLPSVYKHIHKPHHRWVIPTPFASHAFHPLDGFVQSLPYHVFIYCFPLQRTAYLCLFVFVNLWTIFIHDSDMIVDHPLEQVVNGPAHHTLHHLYFTCNYGQFFTTADKYFGSYRQPAKGDDPLLVVLARNAKSNQAKDLENAKRQEAESAAALALSEGVTLEARKTQ